MQPRDSGQGEASAAKPTPQLSTIPSFPPPALPPGLATWIVVRLFHEKDHFGENKMQERLFLPPIIPLS